MHTAAQVIELQPGTNGAANVRPDWTPYAQLPDHVTGVMAHTPDPNNYHSVGDGRTMLPRASLHGGSRGFSQRPGVVNVDPTDWTTGAGGFTIDMEKVDKRASAEAFNRAGGNPLEALALLSGQQVAPGAVKALDYQPHGVKRDTVAPPGHYGYVVPQATPGGAQLAPEMESPVAAPAAMSAAAAALGSGGQTPIVGTVQNASVKPPGNNMPAPQLMENSAPQSNTVTAPYPHPHAQQEFTSPPTSQAAPPMPVMQAPQYYPPPQPDQTQLAMMQALQQMTDTLARINSPPPTAHSPPATQTPWTKQDVRRENEEIAELRRQLSEMQQGERTAISPELDRGEDVMSPAREPEPAVPEGCGLEWLTTPPSRPEIRVYFNLGAGGEHLMRYHHITRSDKWLSMIYDNRFEYGNQFIPPTTKDGDPPITIRFPDSGNETLLAAVPPGCHMQIGCMDIINFVVVEPSGASQVPMQ